MVLNHYFKSVSLGNANEKVMEISKIVPYSIYSALIVFKFLMNNFIPYLVCYFPQCTLI